MKEKEIRHFFYSKKKDIPPDGFSEHLLRQLPKREAKPLLPLIFTVMSLCGSMGICILLFSFTGPFLALQVKSFFTYLNRGEYPPVEFTSAYLVFLILIGVIYWGIHELSKFQINRKTFNP